MKPIDWFEKLIRDLHVLEINTSAEMDQRILHDTLKVQQELKQTKLAGNQPDIWRIIMKSPITKLAAAAAIIIAVLIGINQLGGSATSVAWSEVLEKAEQCPTVIFDMTVEITYSKDNKLQLQSENFMARNYGTKSNIYHNGELNAVKYLQLTEKTVYQVSIDRKEYLRVDLSDQQVAQLRDQGDPRTWLKMILSGDYTKLDSTDINGLAVEGIECNWSEMTSDENGIIRLWVDVEKNLPVRIEVEKLGMDGGQMRPQKFIMDNFRWDVELDESVFKPNIPEDYTLLEK